jgi:hypothetical protein
MPSGIIKENLTSFCFLRLRKRVATGLSNVVRGWAVYYITTTETPRELIGEQVPSDGWGRFGRPRAEPALVVAVADSERANQRSSFFLRGQRLPNEELWRAKVFNARSDEAFISDWYFDQTGIGGRQRQWMGSGSV